MFGLLLVISFFDFKIMNKHFKFLRTVTGKGLFNLFIASMFLVGNGGKITGYIMSVAFAAVGIFFVCVGCACIKGYDDSDVTRDDISSALSRSFSGRNIDASVEIG